MKSAELAYPSTPQHGGHSEDFISAKKLATDILREVMRFRRNVDHGDLCDPATCLACLLPHINKVASAIYQQTPIRFVLPAFPGKSPNPAKVLGPLPDMAERQARQFLNSICRGINRLYAPGAQILLCSDGRVFNDVVGMTEEDVSAYQIEIARLIHEMGLTYISTYSLEDLSKGASFAELRRNLMEQHGTPLVSLREKVRRGGNGSKSPEDIETHRMYCGITRFLVEDSIYPGQTKSRTAIQKDCRVRAYEVIRRSNAWSNLIAEQFPQAVRLSIHPQACGARKMGIQLLGTDSWLTPWHGVAVDTSRGFILMKRWEAENAGATVVRDGSGRASHYKLPEADTITEEN